MTDRLAEVAELWEVHMQAAFPSRLRAADVVGVDMVLVDADVAGCISSWLHRGGRSIDDWRRDILATCKQQLLRVIPELDDDEASYYQRLLNMTILVLDAPDDAPSS